MFCACIWVALGCIKSNFLAVRHFHFFPAHWWVTFLMQQRELPWTLQDAPSTEGGYILSSAGIIMYNLKILHILKEVLHPHPQPWNKNFCVRVIPVLEHNKYETLRLRRLIKHSVCFGDDIGWSPGVFSIVVRINLKHHSMASLGLKTVFIIYQSFCYTCDDETTCLLCSQRCPTPQMAIVDKTLDQLAHWWKSVTGKMSVKIWLATPSNPWCPWGEPAEWSAVGNCSTWTRGHKGNKAIKQWFVDWFLIEELKTSRTKADLWMS